MSFSLKATARLEGYGQQKQLSNGEYTQEIRFSNPEANAQYSKTLIVQLYSSKRINDWGAQNFQIGELLDISLNLSTYEGQGTNGAYAKTTADMWSFARAAGQQTAAPTSQHQTPTPQPVPTQSQGTNHASYAGKQVQDASGQWWWNNGQQWYKNINGQYRPTNESPVFANVNTPAPTKAPQSPQAPAPQQAPAQIPNVPNTAPAAQIPNVPNTAPAAPPVQHGSGGPTSGGPDDDLPF